MQSSIHHQFSKVYAIILLLTIGHVRAEVGLAVKASQQNCRDPLFSFLTNIESYRICCSDKEFSESDEEVLHNPAIEFPEDAKVSDVENNEGIKNSQENSDGTIVLKDDDDICGKVPNLCQQICENTFDAYKCSCNPGYVLDDNNVTCTWNKINKTTTKQHRSEISGSNVCPIGYVLATSQGQTQSKCVDIDECKEELHKCKTTQYCHNTIGGYRCLNVKATSCEEGYRYNIDTDQCEDENECKRSPSPCNSGLQCINYPGGYECQPGSIPLESRTCGIGYYLQDDRCTDIDECQNGTTNTCNADLHQECKNTLGSYHCNCLPGFSLDVTQHECVDINECETGEHNCDDKQICHNRNGGYICACPTGHQVTRLSNGINSCVDIDECSQDQPPCSSNAHCFNTIGSFYCECKSGFQKNLSNDKNIDETGNTHNAQCFDVDECQTIPGLCQQKCVNFWGGYRCTCNPGYQLSRDNRTCNDIDECEVHKDYKLCMGICFNSAGSYQCSCPRGYTLAADKTSCHDIDECAGSTGMTPSNHVCTGRNDVCTNIRGNYKCTTINCPHGYIKDPDVD
ncbi:CG31999, partial [Drosophila busckii]